MPEGPEVKYLVSWLNKDIKNKKLMDIIFHSGRYKKHGPPKNINKLSFPVYIEKEFSANSAENEIVQRVGSRLSFRRSIF